MMLLSYENLSGHETLITPHLRVAYHPLAALSMFNMRTKFEILALPIPKIGKGPQNLSRWDYG